MIRCSGYLIGDAGFKELIGVAGSGCAWRSHVLHAYRCHTGEASLRSTTPRWCGRPNHPMELSLFVEQRDSIASKTFSI